MNSTFQNKVVIVTGAGSGIGQSTALAFAHQGAKVVVADYIEIATTLDLIRKTGAEAVIVKCDVSKESEVKNLIEITIKTFGKLDLDVNNAGTEGVSKRCQDVLESEWDRNLDVNLKGVWLCMKYQSPELLKNKQGAIVNVASVAGQVAFPNLAPYVASKHGVIGLTKAVALDNTKTNIRINAVCPGVIKTPMVERSLGGNAEAEAAYSNAIPMGRLGKPEEIANTILFLCSDEASYITGQSFTTDGGWTIQ